MACTLLACYHGPDVIVEVDLGEWRSLPPPPELRMDAFQGGRCCTVALWTEDRGHMCADPGGWRDCELTTLPSQPPTGWR